MAKKHNELFDYQTKSTELDGILQRLQDADIQVDEASTLYAKGLVLVEELEIYLKHAENTVRAHASEV